MVEARGAARKCFTSTEYRVPSTEHRVPSPELPATAMPTAVLLMAHGTPDRLDEMPEYLRLVRGGRPPSPELIEEMTRNYESIGGRSPLTAITEAQGRALASRLGDRVAVAIGMRHWRPFIADPNGSLEIGRASR